MDRDVFLYCQEQGDEFCNFFPSRSGANLKKVIGPLENTVNIIAFVVSVNFSDPGSFSNLSVLLTCG